MTPWEPERPGETGPSRLERFLDHSGLTFPELWRRQLAVGGDADVLEVEAYLLGVLPMDPYQYDLLAQALNESFLDDGNDHPVPYSDGRNHLP